MAETRPPAPAAEIAKAEKPSPTPTANFGVLVNQGPGNPLDVRFSERPSTVFEIGSDPIKPWPAPKDGPKNEPENGTASPRFGDAAPQTEDPISRIPSDELDRVAEEMRRGVREGRFDEKPPYLGSREPAPAYSTAPFEGSRENAGFGVGDLPPGPKTGEYDGPISVNGSERRAAPQSRPRLYPKDQYGEDRKRTDLDPNIYPDHPDFRFGMPPRNEGKDSETDPAVERGKKLAGLSFVKGLMERAKNVAKSIPEVQLKNWFSKNLTNVGAGIVAIEGIIMVLMSQGDSRAADSGPKPFPGNQYNTEAPAGPILGPELVFGPDVPPPLPAGEQDPQAGAITPEKSREPGVEQINFPAKVTNRALDGLIKAQVIYAVDKEYQERLKERGINPADVDTKDSDFQAALFRTTVEMGGDPELNAVVKREAAKQRREIQDLNLGRIIFDRVDPNKIVGNNFDARTITPERIDKDREEIRQERQGEGRQAVAYIRDTINSSSDPDTVKLLEDLDSGSAQMRLIYSQGTDGQGYAYHTYEMGGEPGRPTLKYTIQGEPGKMTQSAEYRKKGGKFESLNIDDAQGVEEEEQKAILTSDFPGIEIGTVKSSMGRYENGGFGRGLYGDWQRNDGKIFAVGVDAVGRTYISEKP